MIILIYGLTQELDDNGDILIYSKYLTYEEITNLSVSIYKNEFTDGEENFLGVPDTTIWTQNLGDRLTKNYTYRFKYKLPGSQDSNGTYVFHVMRKNVADMNFKIKVDYTNLSNPYFIELTQGGSNKFTDLIKNSFGFLTYPFELISNIFTRYINLTDTGHYILHIPEMKNPIGEVVLIQSQNWDLGDLMRSNDNVFTFYKTVKMALSGVICLGFGIFSFKKIMGVLSNG